MPAVAAGNGFSGGMWQWGRARAEAGARSRKPRRGRQAAQSSAAACKQGITRQVWQAERGSRARQVARREVAAVEEGSAG